MKHPRTHARAVIVCSLFMGVLASLLTAGVASGAERVSIVRLIDQMRKYDGKEITIQGEVIGERMVRGDHAWITVNDDRYSRQNLEEGGQFVGMSNAGMGVWVETPETDPIEFYGVYKNKGDIVTVTGIFHRADPEHGGDTDIHATAVEVVQQGHQVSHPFQYWKFFTVVLLSAAIVLLWNVRRERKRRIGRRL
jgi:hypothetical protein